MKKIKFSSSNIIIALCVSAVVFSATIVTSCKKDTAETVKMENKPFTVKTGDMNAYLTDFKTRLQSGLKSGETLETEEAMWHLTALLNFDYGDAGHEFFEFVTDTSYIVISKTGDGVSYETLNSAYTDLQTFVENVYTTSDLDDKHIYFVVSQVVSDDGENITIQTVSTLGNGRGSFSSTFGPADYWKMCYGYGKCGEYEGQCIGRGATTELTRMIRLHIPVAAAINGTVYFTDIWEGCIFNPENYPDPDSPHGYEMFINPGGGTPPHWKICLSPDDLNYYLPRYIRILNEQKQYQLQYYNHNPLANYMIDATIVCAYPVGKNNEKEDDELGRSGGRHFMYFNCGKVNVIPGGGAID